MPSPDYARAGKRCLFAPSAVAFWGKMGYNGTSGTARTYHRDKGGGEMSAEKIRLTQMTSAGG